MNWILKWEFLIIKLIWTILSLIFLIFTFFLLFLFFRFKQNKKGRKKDKISKKWYKEFYNFCKCYIDKKKSILLYIILAVMMLGLPIAIQNNYVGIGISLKKCINIGAPSAWLGFWGSYLGSVLTILFAYFNTEYQTSKIATANREEKSKKLKATLENSLKRISYRTIFDYDRTGILNIDESLISYLDKNSEEIYNDINKIVDLESSLKDMNLKISTEKYKELSDELMKQVTSLSTHVKMLYSCFDEFFYTFVVDIITKNLSNISSTVKDFRELIESKN